MSDDNKLSRRRFLQFLGITGAALNVPKLSKMLEAPEDEGEAQEAEDMQWIIDSPYFYDGGVDFHSGLDWWRCPACGTINVYHSNFCVCGKRKKG